MAEKAFGTNGTIVPFVTSDNSRRDNEMEILLGWANFALWWSYIGKSSAINVATMPRLGFN